MWIYNFVHHSKWQDGEPETQRVKILLEPNPVTLHSSYPVLFLSYQVQEHCNWEQVFFLNHSRKGVFKTPLLLKEPLQRKKLKTPESVIAFIV